MKRDFLKNLGIEDKDIIDKILDENSSDIGRAKGELETYKNKVSELETSLSSKDAEIKTLKSQVGDTTSLNDKIAQLETEKQNITNDLNAKVLKIQKDHAIEGKIRDRKGKNVKAIRALLDDEKITFDDNVLGGIDEQLDALAVAEDSSMLFGDAVNANPTGLTPANPPTNNNSNPPTSKTFSEAVAKALTANK